MFMRGNMLKHSFHLLLEVMMHCHAGAVLDVFHISLHERKRL